MHRISKSTYLRGVQCKKSLHLNKYHSEYRDPVPESRQAVFDKGHMIGKLAQELFPGGIDATRGNPFNIKAALYYTSYLIDSGQKIVYEAAFEFDGVLCYLDILVNENGKWKAFEVKGSTGLKNYYINDASVQYYIINNSGLALEDISIIYLNNQYVRKGEIDLSQLFIMESVLERIRVKQDEVESNIEQFRSVLDLPFHPDIDIGPYCSDPYDCDFAGYCWKHIPENSVFDINGLHASKKFELYNKGIVRQKDIPDDYPLNENQWLQVNSLLKQETMIKKDMIRSFLHRLSYPLYFLDFESFQPAIPIYDHSRPYQQIVFQYSLHLLSDKNAELQHFEFLAKPNTDPRIGFIESLIRDCGKEGSVLVYNKSFERGRLNEIVRDFPENQKGIDNILSRIVDLMEPFQKKYFYTPAMHGSYSIKQVLPALVPDLTYNDLEINEGGMASLAFERLQTETDPVTIDKIRNDLLAYCRVDTLAMVKLLKKLKEVIKRK